jgi:hypothetical protein
MKYLYSSHRPLFVLVAIVLSCLNAQETNETIIESAKDDNVTMVDCPLCSDPSHVPQDPFSIFVAGDATMSCQTAFDMGPIRLPAQNCSFWQQRGTAICQCASESPPTNTCTLCENGQSLPNPFLEGRPGVTCAELQIQARCDDPEHCGIWQQTQGIYCGCDNDVEPQDGVCRLCGSDTAEWIRPLEMVSVVTTIITTTTSRASNNNGDDTTTMMSCAEVEFQANLPENQEGCDEYVALYAEQCCREPLTATLAPSEAPTMTDLDGTAALNFQIGFGTMMVAAAALMQGLVY